MRLFYTISIMAFLFTATSCVREGCTDEKAINYNAQADDNDGSCVYKRDVTEGVKEDRRTYEFELQWDDSLSYEEWQVPVGLQDRSVLLYMKHPVYNVEEWVAMPFSQGGTDYYYSEEQNGNLVWVYIQDQGGKPVYVSGETTEHKAVVLENKFMKENPDVKEKSYQEVKAMIEE